MRIGNRRSALVVIKLLHTAIWVFFGGCIIALPVFGVMRRFDWALAVTALIFVECAVLAVNRGRCPLTNVAARYTHDRAENFDIYLPKWIARHNKVIFGTLFVVDEAVVLWCRFG